VPAFARRDCSNFRLDYHLTSTTYEAGLEAFVRSSAAQIQKSNSC
jgi:hypothetical protein